MCVCLWIVIGQCIECHLWLVVVVLLVLSLRSLSRLCVCRNPIWPFRWPKRAHKWPLQARDHSLDAEPICKWRRVAQADGNNDNASKQATSPNGNGNGNASQPKWIHAINQAGLGSQLTGGELRNFERRYALEAEQIAACELEWLICIVFAYPLERQTGENCLGSNASPPKVSDLRHIGFGEMGKARLSETLARVCPKSFRELSSWVAG